MIVWLRAFWWLIKCSVLALLIYAATQLTGDVRFVIPAWLGGGDTPLMVQMRFSVLIIGLVIAAVVLLWLSAVVRDMVGLPASWQRWRRQSRHDAGYDALTRGLVAVAAGDAKDAKHFAKIAARKLGQPPLTLLLTAQAAQLAGDDAGAQAAFQLLAADPKAGFLGLRGQLGTQVPDALRTGQVDRLLPLVERARQLQPKSRFVLQTLFALECRRGNWQGARDVLRQAVKRQAIAPDVGRQHEAVLLLCQSQNEQDATARFHTVRAAYKTKPDFCVAAIQLATLHGDRNEKRDAARILERLWRQAPHPLALKQWQRCQPAEKNNLVKPDGMRQVKWLQRLTKQNENHVESHIALAAAFLDAGLWGEARHHLMAVHTHEHHAEVADVRVYKMLAELELQQNNNHAASDQWREIGHQAILAPAWQCDACYDSSVQWQALCHACGAFDRMVWRNRTQPHSPALLT